MSASITRPISEDNTMATITPADKPSSVVEAPVLAVQIMG